MTSDIAQTEIDQALQFLDTDLGPFSELDLSQLDNLKKSALNQIDVTEYQRNVLAEKLKDYRFIDELNSNDVGRYIRWVNLSSNKPKLTNGGIVIDIKIQDNGLFAICKNNRNMIFQVNVANSLIFELMNESELLIKTLYDYSTMDED